MNREEAIEEMERASVEAAFAPGFTPRTRFTILAAEEGVHDWERMSETLDYDIFFALGCLNHWSREYGMEMLRVVTAKRPLVVAVPKILYPDDPIESLWTWSDFSPFNITADCSTGTWIIYRLGC